MRARIAAWLVVVLAWGRRRAQPSIPEPAGAPDRPLYLVMTTKTSVIRVYDRPDGYEQRLPYLGIMSVDHVTDEVAHLHGAHIDGTVAKVDRQIHTQALTLLRERGFTKLLVERHGHLKPIELQ
ncbi:hypothetical protein HH212_26215 [Massilia forsythiae]|uniref:Uncharacterized protein n=1 Tax=Massilia forsythiae TaxID=2728020 RepID=A0A7Z2ZV25_9BURK|nr:hypothetical protein [Massilia forsythiae]QJE03054.1 hypothetical protein HH212_26215 [Massilia forsythiae]